LRSKGIDNSTIEESVAGDDSEAAYRAGLKKVRTLRAVDFETFRHKLLPFSTAARLRLRHSAPGSESVVEGQPGR